MEIRDAVSVHGLYGWYARTLRRFCSLPREWPATRRYHLSPHSSFCSVRRRVVADFDKVPFKFVGLSQQPVPLRRVHIRRIVRATTRCQSVNFPSHRHWTALAVCSGDRPLTLRVYHRYIPRSLRTGPLCLKHPGTLTTHARSSSGVGSRMPFTGARSRASSPATTFRASPDRSTEPRPLGSSPPPGFSARSTWDWYGPLAPSLSHLKGLLKAASRAREICYLPDQSEEHERSVV